MATTTPMGPATAGLGSFFNLIHHPGKLDGVWICRLFGFSYSTFFTIRASRMGSWQASRNRTT